MILINQEISHNERITFEGDIPEEALNLILNMTFFDVFEECSSKRLQLVRNKPHVFPQQYLNQVVDRLVSLGLEVVVR